MTIWENLHRKHAQGKVGLDLKDPLDYMNTKRTHLDDMEADEPLWTIERLEVGSEEDNNWGTQLEPTGHRVRQTIRKQGEGTRMTGKKRPSAGQKEIPRPQRSWTGRVPGGTTAPQRSDGTLTAPQ